MKFSNKLFVLSSLFLLLPLNGCTKDSVAGIWNKQQIKIDGFYADWGSDLLYNAKNNVGFGVANDSSNLYLCLISADQQIIRQVMMRGLECSIDAPGSKNNILKIKYPVGMSGMDKSMRPGKNIQEGETSYPQRDRNNQYQESSRPDPRQQMDSEDKEMPSLEDIQTEFQIFGPKKDNKRIVPLKNNLGVVISVGRSQRQLVYELEIPLDLIRNYLKLADDAELTTLDLKFAMPEMETPDMSSRGEMGGPPGGGGGMGNPPGGGMGGGPGGGMGGPPGGGTNSPDQSSQSFKFNVNVTLANPA